MRGIHALLIATVLVSCSGESSPSSSPSPGLALHLVPTRYELDFTVDYEGEVLSGRSRIEVANHGPSTVREIPLLLYRLLTVSEVRDAQGRSMPFEQVVSVFAEFGKLQVNFIRVEVPRGLAPGESTSIELDYAGHLLGYSETGMLYIRDHIKRDFTILRMDSFCYPLVGYPSFGANNSAPEPRYSYTARVTVPESLTVANGGRLTSRTVDGDRATYTFQNIRPAWRMDFAISEYEVQSAGPVRVVHFPEDRAGARRVLAAIEATLDLYSEWFGALRQEEGFTFIEIPDGWGSQADVTSVLQTAAAFKDPARVGEVYHELSHLWNAPSNDASPPRWNEGLAEFLALLVAQHLDGLENRDTRVESVCERIRRIFSEQPRYREIPMVDYGRELATDVSYRVGLVMFDVLYRLIGHQQFAHIIGEYYRRFGDTGGTTRDFVALADDMTERSLEKFFEDWMFTTNWIRWVEAGVSPAGLADHYRLV